MVGGFLYWIIIRRGHDVPIKIVKNVEKKRITVKYSSLFCAIREVIN
jgi:hypothetical protein